MSIESIKGPIQVSQLDETYPVVQVELTKKLEMMPVPAGLNYKEIKALSYESIEKFSRVRPLSLGQASRIPGVRPSDIAILMGYLQRFPKKN